MKIEFAPVDYDYFDFEGKNYLCIIGRNGKGEKICVVDTYEPNFWVILKDAYAKRAEKLAKEFEALEVEGQKRTTKVTKTKVCKKKFLGKDVTAIRVYVTNHKDAHDIASAIGERKEIEARREYDISLITKYIKEEGLKPLMWHELEAEAFDAKEDFGGALKAYELGHFFTLKSAKKLKKEEFVPKILSYDLEAEGMDPLKDDLLSIGLYGKTLEKVITWKKVSKPASYVKIMKNEREVVEEFVEEVKRYDPDILVGYFSDGFDLPFLKGISLSHKFAFRLGLDGREPVFSRGRIPSGKIAGIVHVDLLRFVDTVYAQYMQSETLKLGAVAKELIGEEKGDFDFSRLGTMSNKDWVDLFSYNLQDCKVTYRLAERLWPDMMEFSKIVEEPLFKVTRDRIAAMVENYIIHTIDQFNEIVEKRPPSDEIGKRRTMGSFEGAFVFEPKPGMYENIVMFDFTSMYPSVIISYNLSKSTWIKDRTFSKKEGFFPIMLKGILERRKKYKKELASSKDSTGIAKARSNAYKLLAAASYGYLAFFGARYYCREAAASTARLSRENIKSTIKTIEKKGYKIIYSDTDSIAFLRGKTSKKDILAFLKEINSGLPGIMELDLEDFYRRGVFVTTRGGTVGAKKKYALISESGTLKIRGFETVRRDWCNLARRLQSEILFRLLKEGNEKRALALLKETVGKLKKGAVSKEDLIIQTKLKKAIHAYQSKGPHVVAAEKMQKKGLRVGQGSLIAYFVGEINGKAKRIGDKVFLPDDDVPYDTEYYLNNQVLPAVENIFDVFDVDVKAILDGESQKTLF